MNANYYLGIDIAKHKVRFELTDAQGTRLTRGAVSTNRAGFAQLAAVLHAHRACPGQTLVLLEATGLLHLPWAEALCAHGWTVLGLNPLLTKRLGAASNALRENKTDPLDAHSLAEIGRLRGTELQRFRYRRDPARFGWQRLHTVREQVRRSLTNLKKCYAGLLDVVFPELGALVEVHNKGVRRLLARASTPEAIARQPMRSLARAFGKHTDAVLTAARATLADPALAESSVPALRAALESIEQMETQLAALDVQLLAGLARRVDPGQYALAATVPGIGTKTATTVLGYLPSDWRSWGGRKRTTAKLQALCGIDPRVRQSGQWVGQARMSKRGIKALRTALFQAAFCATIHDEGMRAYYQRKRAEGKAHKVALSHLMRILLRRLVAVLKTERPYEACYAGRAHALT